MVRNTCRPQIAAIALGLLGLIALELPRSAAAAVAILSDPAAPVLVLVDADRLDPTVLARLVAAGFGSPYQFETGCEVVDAGLLIDRLRGAHRVVALVSAADAALVQDSWQGLGGRMGLRGSAEAVPKEGPVDLRDLRDALGDAGRGLHALEGMREAGQVTAGARCRSP